MAHLSDTVVDDRERQLAEARAAFRRERDADRDRRAADRAEIDRLKREAETLRREAARTRDRTKRLAGRFARRVRQKWADVRADLDARQVALDEARGQFSAEVARFQAARSEFFATAAEDKDRLRDEWAALDAQRRRAAAEWAEADDFVFQQDAALAARAAELTDREKAVAGARAKLEQETAALRQEAAGLEARIQHGRALVAELEEARDRLRAELLAAAAPPELTPAGVMRVALDRAADRDLTQWAADLTAQDQRLAQEKANLGQLQTALDRDAAALADQRKVVAEQLAQLAAARGQWQDVEARTVAEMEELARGLQGREEDLAAREQRLVRADARRREESYELWQFRLRLEAWQSKLTTVGRLWLAERERREDEYAARVRALAARQAALHEVAARWERARAGECDRLRAELQLWADDRARLAAAAAACDRATREAQAELVMHAARATAAEDLMAEAVGTGGGVTRRFAVLRKRWERVFEAKLGVIDGRRAAAAAELARLDERYHELHRLLADVAEREADLASRAARLDAARLDEPAAGVVARVEPTSGSAELEALRAEVERMATVLLEAGVPEPGDDELPWAADAPDAGGEADVLPFALPAARAA